MGIVLVVLAGIGLSVYWLVISTIPIPALPPGLSVEEHELKGVPELEPLTFTPLEGTQEEILHKHQVDREKSSSLPNPTQVSLGENELIATTSVRTTEQGEKEFVEISRNGETIYSAQLGDAACPIPSLWGLWVYDNHWVLETAIITLIRGSDNSIDCSAQSQIIQDGVSLNEKNGYQESFGFQLMNSNPFYFFKKGARWGVSYDNQEIDLGYTRISHYECCSGSALNPRSAENMVSFFSQRGSIQPVWYYVEIGVFE
jgi:hypothetical protein